MSKHKDTKNCVFSAALLMPVFSFIFTLSLHAQPGGKAFQFLEITNSARVASLGGDMVAVHDTDPELTYHNPALLNLKMNHYLTLNYVNYFAGANFGYASLACKINEKSALAAGIHYLYYGTFQGADEYGVKTGKFKAADYSINVTYSRKIDSLFTAGITVKNVYSDYESYNAAAVAFDAGITYTDPDSKFSAGLVLRNMGIQVNSYSATSGNEPLPFNIALGLSKGLAYAPFSFNVVFNHIEKWDLRYQTEAEKEKKEDALLNGENTDEGKFDVFLDQFMRHVVIGTTLDIGQHLELRAGYNYRRRQELKIDTKPGMVGFSWGIGLNLSKFKIGYGRGIYHQAGGTNQFSFSMNLDEFSRKF